MSRPGNIAAFEPDQQRVIEDIYDALDGNVASGSSTVTPSYVRSGGGGGGGGLSKADADGYYFKIDDNLSESEPEQVRKNIELSKDDDVQFNKLSFNADNWIDWDATDGFTFDDSIKALGASFVGDVSVSQNLNVQGGLFAKEFVVDVTKVRFDEAMSPGGGMVVSVSGSAGSETITFEDENGNSIVPVAANDIIHIQHRTGITTGSIVKNIWRKVASITGSDVTLTTTGITWSAGTDDVGSIASGDHVVVKGNTGNTSRDHYINYQVSGVTIPRVSVYDSVTDVNNAGTEVLRWGGLDSFNAGVTGSVGFAAQNAGGDLFFYVSETKAGLGDLDIGGTLTMATTGAITNADGDYTLDDTGLSFAAPSSWTSGDNRNMRWIGTNTNAEIGSFGLNDPVLRMGGNEVQLFSTAFTTDLMRLGEFTVWTGASSFRSLSLDVTGISIDTSGLPKSYTDAQFADVVYLHDAGSWYELRIRK